MTTGPLTVAIVGAGKQSEQHVKEIRKIAEASIVAVCDKEPLLAEQLAERYSIPHQYSSLEEIYNHVKPDVVHIVTPPRSHLAIGRIACENGSHIYVEKPFTINYPEAVELIEVAERTRSKVTVGHIYHFDPVAAQVRRMVASGLLGEPVNVEVTMGYDLETEYGQALLHNRKHWIYDLPGGLFQNIISHMVEKVLEFMPDESPSVYVYAFLRNQVLRQDELKIMDELRVILAGTEVTAQLTFSTNFKPSHTYMRVYGTQSTIDVDFNSQTAILRRGRQFPTMIGKIMRGLDLGWQYQKSGIRNFASFLKSDFNYFTGMNYLIRAFYSSIREQSEPPIPYKDILRTTKYMDLIFERLPQAVLYDSA